MDDKGLISSKRGSSLDLKKTSSGFKRSNSAIIFGRKKSSSPCSRNKNAENNYKSYQSMGEITICETQAGIKDKKVSRKIKKFGISNDKKLVSGADLQEKLIKYTKVSRKKRSFDKIEKSILSSENSLDNNNNSPYGVFHPVSKKIKLYENPSVKIMGFDSNRISTNIRCYEDQALFNKETNPKMCKKLRYTRHDNDADTTESEKQKGQNFCYQQLMSA